MLGAPNRGSHLMVETLFGRSGAIRQLARLDRAHAMQWLLDLVAEFPGALQWLPRPGFADTGGVARDYYAPAVWSELKAGNDDAWFGAQLGAVPAAPLLHAAATTWGRLDEQLPNADRIASVAGYGQLTPCGVEQENRNGRPRVRQPARVHRALSRPGDQRRLRAAPRRRAARAGRRTARVSDRGGAESGDRRRRAAAPRDHAGRRLLAAPDRDWCDREADLHAPASGEAHGGEAQATTPGAPGKPPTHPQRRHEVARTLHFVHLSQRARAEDTKLQYQPGLAETLVESSVGDPTYKPDLAHAVSVAGPARLQGHHAPEREFGADP
jgi:hypothetical protein